MNIDSFPFSLQSQCFFISHLIALARISSTSLVRSSKNRHPCLIPDLRTWEFKMEMPAIAFVGKQKQRTQSLWGSIQTQINLFSKYVWRVSKLVLSVRMLRVPQDQSLQERMYPLSQELGRFLSPKSVLHEQNIFCPVQHPTCSPRTTRGCCLLYVLPPMGISQLIGETDREMANALGNAGTFLMP